MKTYTGSLTGNTVRFKEGSGGIGTAILKYLFDSEQIGTAVSFDFNTKSLKYEPRMIYSFNEYDMSGSINHETDLVSFIREHVKEIKGVFCCLALPCQIDQVRTFLNRNIIPSFLLGLTCSSQQSFEAANDLSLTACSKCQNTISLDADITLGDPWLKEDMPGEKTGKAIICVNTLFGEKVLNGAVSKRAIAIEAVDGSLSALLYGTKNK